MSNKFDEMARSLAGPSTRRQLLKKLSVGLAATGLACFGLAGRAKADQGGCKEPGKQCHNGSECCSGWCQTGFGKYKNRPKGTCL